MGDKSNIEWTDASWNPVTGCDRVSPGCAHCYALTLAKRLKAMGNPRYQRDGGKASGPGFGVTLHEDVLALPLGWKRPRRVFVNSMSDLFHEAIPDEFLDRVFALMALTPQHTYQVLTKRPERMREYMRPWHSQGTLDGGRVRTEWGNWESPVVERLIPLMARSEAGRAWRSKNPNSDILPQWPLPNVWLGTSVENQHWADIRIPILLDTPAAVRFLSCEPLLGPLWIRRYLYPDNDPLPAVNWVIAGGESGPKHRPFRVEWAESIRDQCKAAGVPFFMKQMGGLRPGGKPEDLPEALRVREFPAVPA